MLGCLIDKKRSYQIVARFLDIVNLCSQPEVQRDEEWERAFLAAFVDAKLQIEEQEAQQGPDGWPYLFARTSHVAEEPVPKIVDWLSTRGIGLVINPHKQIPDYIFTYGMIWGLKEHGFFLPPDVQVREGPVVFEKGEKVIAGPPTESYLPIYVREILVSFFKEQGVSDPKILVLSKDKKHFDLCFSVESLGSPENQEHKGIAEAIAWFLPQHYSVVIMSDHGLPKFFPLKGTA